MSFYWVGIKVYLVIIYIEGLFFLEEAISPMMVFYTIIDIPYGYEK